MVEIDGRWWVFKLFLHGGDVFTVRVDRYFTRANAVSEARRVRRAMDALFVLPSD